MNEFEKNSEIVISELHERGFSAQSIYIYRKVYNSLQAYLEQAGIDYTPELGKWILLPENRSIVAKGDYVLAGCISKLDDVYRHGHIQSALMTPRRTYSSIVLNTVFSSAISQFMNQNKEMFTESHQYNVHRRCSLFLKCMQHWGKSTFNEIMYEDINRYHLELSHLKKVSRIVEESSLHPFLKFVYENNGINPGLYLYMYQLERDIFIPLETLPADLQQRISEIQDESLNYPPDRFLKKGLDLIRICLETGYVESYVSEMKLAVLYLYLFLDLNHLGYLPEIADIWFNSIAVNHLFHGSTVHSASRILHLFRDYMITGEADLGKVYRKGIKGLAELPEWYRVPLDGYISQRSKQKFDPKTVKNDIFFLLRFYSFLSRNDVKSFAELTGKLISDFNLYDKHGTSEGKNQCNCGIRRFLKYLFRESLITDAYLPYALLPAAAPVETLAQTLTEEEIEQARTYIMEAKTPIQLRDSAIFLLGVDMGLRGSDIVSLKLEDIDWKNECIRFQQQKTDVDAWSIMPVAVGNALFRYLKNGRPRGIKNDYLFVSISSPHKKLSRCICYGTLKRIFPNRKVAGSGFHVTRKTFSTNRLNSAASPEQIANALGHSGTGSLTPYLSLDTGHMCQCPLSLDILNISLKGGF